MCLVEVERMPKLQPSCATPVSEGMVVRTQTPETLRNRQSVLEFLLLNHPLDCPVCDQSGECELQNYYMAHGRYDPRFNENKTKREEGHADRPLRDPGPGALHPVHALRPVHGRDLQDGRAWRDRSGAPQRDRRLPGRGVEQSLLRERRRHLPRGRADRPGFPLPVPRLVPGAHALNLSRMQPRLQHRDPLQRALQRALP